jgi:Cep192 domain 4
LLGAPVAGRAQAVSLSATTLTFSSTQFVGSSSAPMTVTLTNTGTATLTISSVTISGTDASDYAQTNTCKNSVVAGGTCTLSVTFTPSKTGTRTATLNINDNAPDTPQTVSLTGTGVAPTISLSPSDLTFPSQVLNTSSTAMTVTLSNTGTASLSITSLTVAGDNKSDFSQTNTCGTSVGANASCTIMVTFTPTASGTRTAEVSIVDNASGSPHSVSLTGMGGDFTITATPATASVNPGQSGTYQITITPQGGLNVAVSLACQGAPPLGICSISPMSVTPDGTNAAKATATVTTGAPGAAPPVQRPRGPFGLLFALAALWAAVLLVQARGRRSGWALASAALLLVVLWTACGGGSTGTFSQGTPPGNYPLTLSGTVGGLSHTTTVTLSVQ